MNTIDSDRIYMFLFISLLFLQFIPIGVTSIASEEPGVLSYYATLCLVDVSNGTSTSLNCDMLNYYYIHLYIHGDTVNVVVKPLDLEGYRWYMVNFVIENFIVLDVPPDSNMSVSEYNEYLREQWRTNISFVEEEYNKYLSFLSFETLNVSYRLLDNNYVADSDMGFFPLYSIRPVYKSFIESVKPSYMGVPLRCEGGCYKLLIDPKLAKLQGYDGVNNKSIVVAHLVAHGFSSGKATELWFKHNYLVYGENVVLKLNETSYLVINEIMPTPETMAFIDSLPELQLYRNDEWMYLVGIGVLVLGFIGLVMWWRRR